MRIPRSWSGLFISILVMGAVMVTAPVAAQAPATPVFGKKATALQQNGVNIGQKATKYLPPTHTQAVLTLTPNMLTAQPNQSIHFELTWDRPVYRDSYHFDWGDGKSNDVTDPSADHAYESPQTYTVRVTATPLANVTMMAMMKPVVIQSNAVSIAVVLPAQPTVTLAADKSNMNVGDTVTLTATLIPPAPDAQYQFNFDDGSAPSSVTTNQVPHLYNAEKIYHPTVTVLTSDGQQSVTSPAVEINVTAPPPVVPPPAPKLTVKLSSKGALIAGTSVEVAAALDQPQKNLSYEFDWGDGSAPERVDAKGVAVHLYATAGLHEVVVTAETEEAYQPPLQGILPLTIAPVPPPPPNWGWMIVLAAIGAVVVLLIIWAVVHMARSPGRQEQRDGPEQKQPRNSHEKIRYVAHEGWAVHELKMRPRSRVPGAITLHAGMGGAEHTILFLSEAAIASKEAERERNRKS